MDFELQILKKIFLFILHWEKYGQVAETFYKNMQKNKEQPFGYSYERTIMLNTVVEIHILNHTPLHPLHYAQP